MITTTNKPMSTVISSSHHSSSSAGLDLPPKCNTVVVFSQPEKLDNNADQMSPAGAAALDEQKVDDEQQQHKQLEETSDEVGGDACGHNNNNDNIIKQQQQQQQQQQDRLKNQTAEKKITKTNTEQVKEQRTTTAAEGVVVETIEGTTVEREIVSGSSADEVTPSPTNTLRKVRRAQGPKSHSVTFISPRDDEDQEKDPSDLVPRRSSWFAATLRRLKPTELIMPSLLPCTKADPNRRASKQIDKQLNRWNKKQAKVIQLLLIGSGESGKTTIIKQMKILHITGFTEEERVEKAREIKENVFEAINEIIRNMAYLRPPVTLDDPSNQPSYDFITQLDPTMAAKYDFPDEFFHHVKSLWADKGVQQCYLRSNEFFLIDCAKYFLDKVDEIRSPDYRPSDQDILRQRRRTCEIQRIEFQVKVPKSYGGGLQSFWMFDVGGQRGERRKWIQVFDGITAVLFLVDSSGFDSRVREDGTTNRLSESLKLFEDIWNSKYLSNSGIILFFNKQDILKEKIGRGSKLEKYFPEFVDYKLQAKDANTMEAGEEEYVRARCFIRDMFLEVTRRKRLEPRQSAILAGEDFKTKRECFSHFTTATDTNNVKRVFDDVHTMILVNTLTNIV